METQKGSSMASDENVKLEDILLTHKLHERKRNPLAIQKQNEAFIRLARETSYGSDAVLQTLCQQAVDLCEAGSSGVSILTCSEKRECFKWEAIAGRFEDYTSGSSPRHNSPCGMCLARDAAQLFAHPERYFTWMAELDAPIVEQLVVPLYGVDKKPFGTIWIMSHDEHRQFDSEDLRIMTALATYGSIALRLQISLTHHVRC
jgi:GAF domain-containing protein